ncbi:TPA: phage tail tip fiber protein [Enterobacter hormaechei]
MKYLSLQQAMLGMRVIMTDDGLILKSPAGSAHYDLKGRRRTVWGDASFFPEHFRVKDKRKPNLSRVVFEKDCTTIYGADGKEKVRIGNLDNLKESKGFRIHANSPLTVNHGQAFIDNALIGGSIKSTNFNVRIGVTDKGKTHEAGMALHVEGDQSKVEFKADRYKVHESSSSIIENVVASATKVKIQLGDEMKQAVIDAVRESDLFASLQASVNPQTASVTGLQQAVHDAVNDALRNALKPGGAIWAALPRNHGRLGV